MLQNIKLSVHSSAENTWLAFMAHWEADLFYCLCDLFMVAVKRWSVVVVLKTSKAALNFFSHCNQDVINCGDCTGSGYHCSGLHSDCTLIALEVACTGL